MAHRILVIDDHPETLAIIQNVLEQNGFDVIATQSSLEGVSLAASKMPDLVMVDGMMPEIDGWEVCRRLRTDERLASIPIIMFSAVGQAEQKLAGFHAGADDYLTKPTEPEEMIERVEALLSAVPPRERPQEENEKLPASPSDEVLKTKTVGMRTPISPTGGTTNLSLENNLIVVVGARGGCGTTTMAINLAASLADAGVSTTLVDLDLVQAHIALYLKQKPARNVNQLASLATDKLRTHLFDVVMPYQDNLQVLLARTNLLNQHSLLSTDQTLNLINALNQPNHCVVVDIGRGVTAFTRPIIEQADQLVVCLRPERVALAAAKKLLTKIQSRLFPHTSLNAALFDFEGGRDIPQQAIESYLGHRLLAVIPIQGQEMTKSVNKGMPLVNLFPESPAAQIFRRLAQQLIKVA